MKDNKTEIQVCRTLPGLSELLKRSDHLNIIACDPGPESSAFIAIRIDTRTDKVCIIDAAYLHNNEEGGGNRFAPFLGLYLPEIVFAYETCTNYGRVIGATVFDTASMGGEIRSWYRGMTSVYAVPSPAWKHALTGFRNANDKMVRACLHEYFNPTGGGADPYKGVRSQPGPWAPIVNAGKKRPEDAKGKSNVQHLVDALGVAIGLYQMRETTKRNSEMFRQY